MAMDISIRTTGHLSQPCTAPLEGLVSSDIEAGHRVWVDGREVALWNGHPVWADEPGLSAWLSLVGAWDVSALEATP